MTRTSTIIRPPLRGPLQHLNETSRRFPAAWQRVEIFRQGRGVDLPKWPAWCFLPMAAWLAIASDGEPVEGGALLAAAGDAATLAAVGAWRYSQGIYRFDTDAGAALADTLMQGEMPSEVLLRLPEWSAYIETPGRKWANLEIDGFWVHLEWDANSQRKELRFLLDTGAGLLPQILHLGPWTVTEAVDRWYAEARKNAASAGIHVPGLDNPDAVQATGAAIQPLLAMVLYLCSDEPEIDDQEAPGERPARPKPTRTKKGWRLFPPKKPRIWTVGEKIGSVLRDAQQGEASGRAVRPHLRRAHWHGFWTGPRDGERKFIYKWLPPTVVAGARDDP
ncbi:MAG: hypothetical protein WC997_17840 [Porticoccaceae bacterium]